MCFLGIDIGTSSICGVVYDYTSSGNIVSITKNNDTHIISSESWEKTQDAAAIVDIVSELIREFRLKYPAMKGIGFSGQMHGIVYANERGEAVSPLYTWQDSRGSLPYKDGLSYAAYLSQTTGIPLSTGFGLVTHFYNQENGFVPEGTATLCTIMDYVVMKLTGRNRPLMDYSNAASLGFFDKARLAFDREALRRVGIDPAILPEVAASGSLAGYYGDVPVYSAIGDNQASFLGSVRDIRSSIHLTVGTSSQLSVYSDDYVEIPSLDTRPLPGGGYILVGAALCGGYSFALLKNFFQETIRLCMGKEVSGADLYEAMTSVPYQSDLAVDLQVETLFDGTRLDPSKRGTISNISTVNLTPEAMILGFLKGIARELYDFYQLVPPSIRQHKTILVGSGNGIKRNPLLRQALEARFACPLHLSEHQEEAALGACLCAMVGGRYIDSFADFYTNRVDSRTMILPLR